MNITSPFTYNLTLRVEIVVAKLFTLRGDKRLLLVYC